METAWISELVLYLEAKGWVYGNDSSDPAQRYWHLVDRASGKTVSQEGSCLWDFCINKWLLDNGKFAWENIPKNKAWPSN